MTGPTEDRAGRPALLAALALGACLLVWPAFVNGYPLVFSDTGAFLHQTLGPLMIWDKPWVYGPLLHLLHWRITLWLPMAAQGLLVSHLLWLALRCCRPTAGPGAHVGLCAVLALCTTLPFSAALLMPDILAPALVLAMALLGFAGDRLTRAERVWLRIVAALAAAAHLAHLPLAAALVLLVLAVRRAWRPALELALPLGLGVLVVLAGNLVGHGRLALSPYGATFLLARMVADGPAARTIAAECPGSGWYLCAWAGRLPGNSDDFLWAPDSPVNRDAAGAPRMLGGALLAPEAEAIIRATIRREPLAVLGNALRDGAIQFVTAGAGDTLGPQHLAATVGRRLALGFPPAEAARFAASRQARGALAGLAAPLGWLHGAALVLGLAGVLLALARPRGVAATMPLRGLLLAVLVGVAANALATGALSGPQPRYQARIAWLLPFGALVAWLPDGATRRRSRRPE